MKKKLKKYCKKHFRGFTKIETFDNLIRLHFNDNHYFTEDIMKKFRKKFDISYKSQKNGLNNEYHITLERRCSNKEYLSYSIRESEESFKISKRNFLLKKLK